MYRCKGCNYVMKAPVPRKCPQCKLIIKMESIQLKDIAVNK